MGRWPGNPTARDQDRPDTRPLSTDGDCLESEWWLPLDLNEDRGGPGGRHCEEDENPERECAHVVGRCQAPLEAALAAG